MCIGHCLCKTFSNCVSLFPDFLVSLGLLDVSQLALVEVAVAITMLVVVALGEAVVLLVLLVSPPCHRVT
jgi:hypothetical protein